MFQAPAEFADAVDFGLDPAIIKSGIELEDHLSIGAFALKLPDDFVLRPELVMLVFFRGNRHEIGQNNFRRVISERCFEHVGVVEVSPRNFCILRWPNAPVSADVWIDNRAKDRWAVETRPAKPVNRAKV